MTVSSFGGLEYVCSGSCFCDDEDFRRSGSAAVISKKGLTYLVTALTSVIAMKKSKEYFEEDCITRLEDECSLTSIHSEVDECNFVLVDDPTEPIDEEKPVDGTNDPDKTEFLCAGRCVAIENWNADEMVTKEMRSAGIGKLNPLHSDRRRKVSEKLGLDLGKESVDRFNKFMGTPEAERLLSEIRSVDLKRGNFVKMFCHEFFMEKTVIVDRKGGFETQEMEAMARFKEVHLHKFCKSNSFLTREEAKKKFMDPGGFAPQTVSAIERLDDNRDRIDGSASGRSYCRAALDGIQLGKIGPHSEKGVVECYTLEVPTITCSRVFKEEEWKEGIPYHQNNLKHWKKGYKLEPPELTWEQLEEDLEVRKHIPIEYVITE